MLEWRSPLGARSATTPPRSLFIHCSRIPRELLSGVRAGDLDVSVEDHRSVDYVAPPYRAFGGGFNIRCFLHVSWLSLAIWPYSRGIDRAHSSHASVLTQRITTSVLSHAHAHAGAGSTVGRAVAPLDAVVRLSTAAAASTPAPVVDPASPTTTIAVRLLNGKREKVTLNLTHTVGDLQVAVARYVLLNKALDHTRSRSLPILGRPPIVSLLPAFLPGGPVLQIWREQRSAICTARWFSA